MKTKQNIFYSLLIFLLMSINIYAQDCGKIRVGYWSTYTIESKGAFTTQLNNLSNYGPHGSYNRINGFKFTDITTLINTLTVDQLLAQFDIINTGYSNMTLSNAQKIKQYVDRGGVALIFLDAGSAVGSNLHQVFGGSGTIGSVNEQPSYATSTSNSLNNRMNGVWGDARNISLKGFASSGLIAINQLPNASIQLANEGSNARVWITGNEGRAIFTWDEGIFNPGDSNVSGTDINTAQEKFIHNIMAYALDKINVAPLFIPPVAPTVSVLSATTHSNGIATITNYNNAYKYTFSPVGPIVDNVGVIQNMTPDIVYKVVANNGCDSPSTAVSINSKIVIQCTNPAATGTPDGYTKIGITTQTKQQLWPGNIPNGFLALESKDKGMVISRVLNSAKITDPKEGMLIYDITDKCVKLHNGTVWNCIKNTCDPLVEAPRKIRIGSFAGYTIGKSNFSAYNSQLTNLSNYGPTGTFKGITGFEFSDLSSAVLTSNTGDQLKNSYDIINTGYSSMTSVQAQHVADFVKEGGVAIINLDNTAYNFNPILTAFGIIGSNGNGAVSAISSSVNELSNVFGNTKNISLSGAATQGRVLANQLPSASTVYANETVTGGGVAVWTIGGDFKGKVIFVWDEGLFRASTIAETIIDTPQERFVHNLMAYALIQLGFQP